MASTFQGKRVSGQWHTVLTEAAKHVNFRLNSGKRTMAEQRALVRSQGLWSYANPHGAAAPNPNAPHIRVGRANHALDVDQYAGDGVQALARWLRSHGMAVNFTVPTEGWHIEASAADLAKLARKFKRVDVFALDERRWINEYDALVKARKNKPRRRVLRRYMKDRRQRIWRLASSRKGGWNIRHRRRRYAALLVRSR